MRLFEVGLPKFADLVSKVFAAQLKDEFLKAQSTDMLSITDLVTSSSANATMEYLGNLLRDIIWPVTWDGQNIVYSSKIEAFMSISISSINALPNIKPATVNGPNFDIFLNLTLKLNFSETRNIYLPQGIQKKIEELTEYVSNASVPNHLINEAHIVIRIPTGLVEKQMLIDRDELLKTTICSGLVDDFFIVNTIPVASAISELKTQLRNALE